jgi:hypothetical protein
MGLAGRFDDRGALLLDYQDEDVACHECMADRFWGMGGWPTLSTRFWRRVVEENFGINRARLGCGIHGAP